MTTLETMIAPSYRAALAVSDAPAVVQLKREFAALDAETERLKERAAVIQDRKAEIAREIMALGRLRA